MKLKQIRAFALKPAPPAPEDKAHRNSWLVDTEVANPMSHYPHLKPNRTLWRPRWSQVGCVVELVDGTFGFGMTDYGTPVISLINDHLGPLLAEVDLSDIDGAWDFMIRACSPFGASGLPLYAISAIDLALWDLKGKLEGKPVYDLLGGPVRDSIRCYATGNDTDWHMELGFSATKLACPFGPADGEKGLDGNEQLIADTRHLIGPEKELMLDCWMAFDLPFAKAMAARVAPYRLGWMEDCLTPEDIEAHHELREALPGFPLATGEHWYGTHPFTHAARHKLVETFQPDICWVGGLTACRRIATIADEAGIDLILHAGINTAYGQHFTLANKGSSMGEYFVGGAPGVPLADIPRHGGGAVPVSGSVRPSNAPGFGLEVNLDEIAA